MDLLALRLKRPLGMSPRWGWQPLRLDYLETQAKQVGSQPPAGKGN
jgi:hypothetical protein